MPQYKSKPENISASAGLLTYPVLQAADILLFLWPGFEGLSSPITKAGITRFSPQPTPLLDDLVCGPLPIGGLDVAGSGLAGGWGGYVWGVPGAGPVPVEGGADAGARRGNPAGKDRKGEG
jgi:hypothetical protein